MVLLECPRLSYPVSRDWPITSHFGEKRVELSRILNLSHVIHQGIDFKTPRGTSTFAACDGVLKMIRLEEDGNGAGNRAWLYADFPELKLMLRIGYFHLDRIDVPPGTRVKRGARIGATGMTGKVTGPHLHFEVRVLPWDTPICPRFENAPGTTP